MTPSPTVQLARDLVRRESLTPHDAGCQNLLADRLASAGFACEHLRFADVDNLWARSGEARPLLVFAGHTDVVPTGPPESWSIPPFSGEIKAGVLHGRGAADMKGSIASFVTACERFLAQHPQHQGSIGLLITSDEEGAAKWGTRAVIEALDEREVCMDFCLVGEPTSVAQCGDVIKVGRRGSLNGALRIFGKQGHIAYPHLAHNPVHAGLAALLALTREVWDDGNGIFPPTSFQISNINAGTGASNVIPGVLDVVFNFRYSPVSSADSLQSRMTAILDRHECRYEIAWQNPALSLPYETKRGVFTDVVVDAVNEVAGIEARLEATGGTSDGRFIAPTGAQVVELGPLNATIHQIDEQVSTDDLDTLSSIYEAILRKTLSAVA